jgi:hypothetical protein
VGTMSPAVSDFPRELLWRKLCWFLVPLLIKNLIAQVYLLDTRFPKELLWRGLCWFLGQLIKSLIAPVSLLFRHTFPKVTTLKEMMLIFSLVVNKKS